MRKLVFRILMVALFGNALACAEPMYGQSPSRYTDSEKSLKQLIEELQDAAVKGDGARFRASANSLRFDGYEDWFKEVFGKRLGGRASEDYATRTTTLVASLFVSFQKLAEGEPGKLEVAKITDPCSSRVLNKEYAVLFARKKRVPLYSVRYKRRGEFDSLGYFIYLDEGFRYLGHIDVGSPLDEILEDIPEPGKVRVGGVQQATKLIEQVAPQYPVKARRAGIQGVVRLAAVVGRDGRIYDLQLINGNCWLAEAAVEAVSKWRYQPTLHKGESVEVITVIDVHFKLR